MRDFRPEAPAAATKLLLTMQAVDTETMLAAEVTPFISEAADAGTIEIQLRDKK
jgi:hypothetical protein